MIVANLRSHGSWWLGRESKSMDDRRVATIGFVSATIGQFDGVPRRVGSRNVGVRARV